MRVRRIVVAAVLLSLWSCAALNRRPAARNDDDADRLDCAEITLAETVSALTTLRNQYTPVAVDIQAAESARVRLRRAPEGCRATVNYEFAAIAIDRLEAYSYCRFGTPTRGTKLLTALKRRAQNLDADLPGDSMFKPLVAKILEQLEDPAAACAAQLRSQPIGPVDPGLST